MPRLGLAVTAMNKKQRLLISAQRKPFLALRQLKGLACIQTSFLVSCGLLNTSERDELIKLRKENRELRREKDFFKLAAAQYGLPAHSASLVDAKISCRRKVSVNSAITRSLSSALVTAGRKGKTTLGKGLNKLTKLMQILRWYLKPIAIGMGPHSDVLGVSQHKKREMILQQIFYRVNSIQHYLAVWMDLYSRGIIGWKTGSNMEAEIVTKNLYRALISRRISPIELVIDTDQCSQYTGRKC